MEVLTRMNRDITIEERNKEKLLMKKAKSTNDAAGAIKEETKEGEKEETFDDEPELTGAELIKIERQKEKEINQQIDYYSKMYEEQKHTNQNQQMMISEKEAQIMKVIEDLELMGEKLQEKTKDAQLYGDQCKKYEKEIAETEDELSNYKEQVYELTNKMDNYETRQISDYNEVQKNEA